MINEEVEALEKEAELTWSDEGKEIEHIPGGYEKVYRYGRYTDVVLYRYKNFVVVYYTPTGIKRKFEDIGKGFEFAKTRVGHSRAIERLLR